MPCRAHWWHLIAGFSILHSLFWRLQMQHCKSSHSQLCFVQQAAVKQGMAYHTMVLFARVHQTSWYRLGTLNTLSHNGWIHPICLEVPVKASDVIGNPPLKTVMEPAHLGCKLRWSCDQSDFTTFFLERLECGSCKAATVVVKWTKLWVQFHQKNPK